MVSNDDSARLAVLESQMGNLCSMLKEHIESEEPRLDRIEQGQRDILMQVTGRTAFVKGAWFGVALLFSGLGALIYHLVGR